MQSLSRSKPRSLEDSRLLPPQPTALLTHSKTLSHFDDSGYYEFNSNNRAGPAPDVPPQELFAASPMWWKQVVEDARIDKAELGTAELQVQALETLEKPAAAASSDKISLPTCQSSRIATATIGLSYTTEQCRVNTRTLRICRLPCVSPSDGQQICCASCTSESQMTRSYACTQYLRGICQTCVAQLMAKKWSRRRCPWCSADGAQFQPNN